MKTIKNNYFLSHVIRWRHCLFIYFSFQREKETNGRWVEETKKTVIRSVTRIFLPSTVHIGLFFNWTTIRSFIAAFFFGDIFILEIARLMAKTFLRSFQNNPFLFMTIPYFTADFLFCTIFLVSFRDYSNFLETICLIQSVWVLKMLAYSLLPDSTPCVYFFFNISHSVSL